MDRKRITVKSKGLRGTNVYTFYHALYIVNERSKGIMFSGQAIENNHNKTYREAKYLPYELIVEIEIEEYDGGLVYVRNPKYLLLADLIANAYVSEECEC